MSRRHAVRGLRIWEEELRPVRGVRRPFGPAQARRPRGPDHGPASQGQIAPLFSASGGPSASVRGRGEYGVRATQTHTRSTFREPLHRVLSRSFNFSFFHLADFASAQTVKVFISETAIAGVVTPEGRKGCRAVFPQTRTPGSEEGDCPSGVKPPGRQFAGGISPASIAPHLEFAQPPCAVFSQGSCFAAQWGGDRNAPPRAWGELGRLLPSIPASATQACMLQLQN